MQAPDPWCGHCTWHFCPQRTARQLKVECRMRGEPSFGKAPNELFTSPELGSATWRAAASRKSPAACRAWPGSTTRNCPPPLEPSRMRAKPSSASRARGSASHSRAIHCDRPASSSSPAERVDRPSAGPARGIPLCPGFCLATGSVRACEPEKPWESLTLAQNLENNR